MSCTWPGLKRVAIGVCVIAATWCGAVSTAAADGDESVDDWEIPPHRFAEVTQPRGFFDIAAIVGATGVRGDLQANRRSADLQFSPVDAVQSFDLEIGAVAEVGTRCTSVWAEIRYLHTITDQFDLDDHGDAILDMRHFVNHLALTRQLASHRDFELGFVVGTRYVYADVELTDDDQTFDVSSSDHWFEPVVGLRGRLDLGDRLFVPYHADIGGLGIGSRLTWQAYAALGWTIDGVDVELGYRHLYLDMNTDANLTPKLHLGGPTLEAGVRF